MGSFDSHLILLQFFMALSPTESFPLQCSYGMFYTCLLPSCVDIFKGCFTSRNERLSLMHFKLVCFFLIMKIVEMLCVWWLHSSETTEWVSELDTTDNRHCLLVSPRKSGLGVRGREGTRRRTSLSRKTASFHVHYTAQRLCLVPVNRLDTKNWYCLIGICTFGFGKKNANPRILTKETLIIWSWGRLSERTLGRILCRKEAYNCKHWSCLLLFSSFKCKDIWL